MVDSDEERIVLLDCSYAAFTTFEPLHWPQHASGTNQYSSRRIPAKSTPPHRLTVIVHLRLADLQNLLCHGWCCTRNERGPMVLRHSDGIIEDQTNAAVQPGIATRSIKKSYVFVGLVHR